MTIRRYELWVILGKKGGEEAAELGWTKRGNQMWHLGPGFNAVVKEALVWYAGSQS